MESIPVLQQLISEKFSSEWEIGVSTLTYPHDPVRAICELMNSDLGLKKIELGLGRRVIFGNYIKELLKLKSKYGLTFSVHVPFLYADIAHPHPSVRKINLDEAKRSIELAEILDAEWVVVHPGSLFLEDSLPRVRALNPLREQRESYIEDSLSSITDLVEYSASTNVKLCLENLPYGLGRTRDEVEKLITPGNNVEFLLDVGHAHIAHALDELIELQPKYIHLHDNDGQEDQHMKLCDGNIGLERVIRKLLDQGGQKTIIFELYNLIDVEESTETLRSIVNSLRRNRS